MSLFTIIIANDAFWTDLILLLNNLREKARVKMGQKAEPGLGIMDSQSVRWVDRFLNGSDGNNCLRT